MIVLDSGWWFAGVEALLYGPPCRAKQIEIRTCMPISPTAADLAFFLKMSMGDGASFQHLT